MERFLENVELGWLLLLKGAALTVELVVISGILGIAFAIPLAMARVSQNPFFRAPAAGFILFFRGTPLLVQTFLIYYGPAQFEWVRQSFLWPVLREAYWCGLLALTLNTMGYVGEVLRGAIQGVPWGEREAGVACGMSRWTLYRRIILPRALRMSLPALSNEIILLCKGSSIVAIITLKELLGNARILGSKTLAYVDFFIMAGVLYLIINYAIAFVFKLLERHYNESPLK